MEKEPTVYEQLKELRIILDSRSSMGLPEYIIRRVMEITNTLEDEE